MYQEMSLLWSGSANALLWSGMAMEIWLEDECMYGQQDGGLESRQTRTI